MILYYALGGGLGHLSRARAVAHTLDLGPVTVLTASERALDPRVRGPLAVELVPRALEAEPALFGNYLLDVIDRMGPEALFVDAFPGGILGELCGLALPPGLPRYHLARLLRLGAYGPRLRGPLPRYERSYVLEPLVEEHEALLRGASGALLPLALRDPPPQGPAPALREELRAEPLWLVVHSEPEAEVLDLCLRALRLRRAAASDARLCLLSPRRPAALPEEIAHVDHYPAAPCLPQAERIITACGFNAMREAAPLRDRHVYFPYPRRLDDQHLRARRAAAASAGG